MSCAGGLHSHLDDKFAKYIYLRVDSKSYYDNLRSSLQCEKTRNPIKQRPIKYLNIFYQ